MAMPLLPQQVMGMMRPEVNRRFTGRPLLSKPEFIQQLLNMIQVSFVCVKYIMADNFFFISVIPHFLMFYMRVIKAKWALLLLHFNE
jgi:hypothetical protein